MNIVKADDKSKAVCEACKQLVDVTFKLRDVPLSDGTGVVNGVLVGVCDVCDKVCVLPHQSVPMVAKTIAKQREPVESRIPAHMVDILNLASIAVGGTTDFSTHLLKYYLHAMASGEISPANLTRYLDSELAKGKAEKRISLKGRDVQDDIEEIKRKISMPSTSKLIRSTILQIFDDILQKKKNKPIRELEAIASACR
jgi:hypothetical protein